MSRPSVRFVLTGNYLSNSSFDWSLAYNENHLKLCQFQARKNREIAALQRKIDEVPSRAELSQYQRRFVELYNQVSSTHRETKQFYTLYNTLDDTKLYLNKEVGLM